MLPDRDDPDMFSGLEERYGIAITELICGPETPIPVWTNDRYRMSKRVPFASTSRARVSIDRAQAKEQD